MATKASARPEAGGRRIRRTRMFPLWALLLGAFVMALIGTSPYYGGTDSYVVQLIGKFLCFAIFAPALTSSGASPESSAWGKRSISASAPTSSRCR